MPDKFIELQRDVTAFLIRLEDSFPGVKYKVEYVKLADADGLEIRLGLPKKA